MIKKGSLPIMKAICLCIVALIFGFNYAPSAQVQAAELEQYLALVQELAADVRALEDCNGLIAFSDEISFAVESAVEFEQELAQANTQFWIDYEFLIECEQIISRLIGEIAEFEGAFIGRDNVTLVDKLWFDEVVYSFNSLTSEQRALISPSVLQIFEKFKEDFIEFDIALEMDERVRALFGTIPLYDINEIDFSVFVLEDSQRVMQLRDEIEQNPNIKEHMLMLAIFERVLQRIQNLWDGVNQCIEAFEGARLSLDYIEQIELALMMFESSEQCQQEEVLKSVDVELFAAILPSLYSAQAVFELIEQLENEPLEHKISAARAAFDALTAFQKGLITNIDKLISAENALSSGSNEEQQQEQQQEQENDGQESRQSTEDKHLDFWLITLIASVILCVVALGAFNKHMRLRIF